MTTEVDVSLDLRQLMLVPMEVIMNGLRFSSSIALLVLLAGSLSAPNSHAQTDQEEHRRDSLVAAARAIMRAAPYCALVTLDESGQPHVRTMDPFPPDEAMVVWFGTHRMSRKVEEIRNDPRVAIHYLEPSGSGYVTIAGTARIVDSPDAKERYWKPEWEQFYPTGKEDFVTIAVTAETLEVVDYSRGIAGDRETWAVPSVKFPSTSSGVDRQS
jgi:general stress protein 26